LADPENGSHVCHIFYSRFCVLSYPAFLESHILKQENDLTGSIICRYRPFR
jgi:hypothetical protein